MPSIYNLRNARTVPPMAVRVDRRTMFGNPFEMKDRSQAERDRVCDAYNRWIAEPEQLPLRNSMRLALAGKDLACWCAPLRCHASTILEIANTPFELEVPVCQPSTPAS